MNALDAFERMSFAVLPTPLYKLENLSRYTGRNIYVKRDDMTGVALGGNKVRKLEYLLYDAAKAGCRTVLTTGGVQSNHAMLTAACCARAGMRAVLVLKGEEPLEYRGNLILDRLFGADIRFVNAPDYDGVYTEMRRIAKELEERGEKTYIIPVGGSVPLGSLGYVRCAREIMEQTTAMGVHIDRIVCTAGSGGTLAGLVAGAELYLDCAVTGIAVGEGDFAAIAHDLAKGTGELLGRDIDRTPEVYDYMGAGYAIPSAMGSAAMRLMAAQEGIVLDPVYTGKCMAGMIDLIEKGVLGAEENILFMHTGGAGGLFAIGA